MLDVFSYGIRSSYPHMSVADTAIWNRFISKYPDAYKTIQYDFHVGDAPAFNTLLDDGTDANQDKLYRLRIDAVAANASGIDVIEIKPNAGPSAIGQVESYTHLYVRDETPKVPVSSIILTDKEMPNMDYLCRQKGIKLIVV